MTASDTTAPDDFHQAYLDALLWLSTDDDDDCALDEASYQGGLHPHTADVLRRQADTFWSEHRSLLERAFQVPGYTPSQAGHDLALSRNGHGAGFFDRGLGDAGDQLQSAATAAGECLIYTGDDGNLYVSGQEPKARTKARPGK